MYNHRFSVTIYRLRSDGTVLRRSMSDFHSSTVSGYLSTKHLRLLFRMGLAIISTRPRTATTPAALSSMGAEGNPEQQSPLPHPLVLQPSETPTPTLSPPSLPPPLTVVSRNLQSFPFKFVITVFEDRARTQIGRHDQPIKHWLRFAEAARFAGHHAMESGFLGEAFVEYAKAAIVVVEVLPQHRDFDVLLSAGQQANLETVGA